jgi:hypothetical protein
VERSRTIARVVTCDFACTVAGKVRTHFSCCADNLLRYARIVLLLLYLVDKDNRPQSLINPKETWTLVGRKAFVRTSQRTANHHIYISLIWSLSRLPEQIIISTATSRARPSCVVIYDSQPFAACHNDGGRFCSLSRRWFGS